MLQDLRLRHDGCSDRLRRSSLCAASTAARSTPSRPTAARSRPIRAVRGAATSAGCRSRRRSTGRGGVTAPPRIACSAGSREQADPAEVVVLRRPAPHVQARRLELLQRLLVDAGLGVDDVAGAVEAGAPDGLDRVEPFVEDARRRRRRARCATACRPPSRSRARARRRPGRGSAPSCSASARRARSGSRTRSTSPSMLFSCRSRPGRKSPVPSPRLEVRTQALPVGVGGDEIGRVALGSRPFERGEQRVHACGRRRARRSGGRRESVSGTPESPARVRKRWPAQPTSAGRSQRCS